MAAVSLETISGLERRIKVGVEAVKIDDEVTGRLKQIAKSAKFDGFRPGKVPFTFVEKRFQRQVRQEVVEKLLNASFRDALKQEKVLPVGGSERVEITHNEPGQDLEYVVTFEVDPEISLGDLTNFPVKKAVVTVSEADIDNEIERQRQALATWVDVNRPIQMKDRVQISFCSAVAPESFADSEWVKDFWLEMGSGQMQPGFEDGLVGAVVDEQRELLLDPPANIESEELQGKKVQFLVKIHKITASQLPEVDEAFCKSLQIEKGVAGLRETIAERLQKYVDSANQRWIKSQVLDELIARHNIEVPKTLIDAEIKRKAQGLLERMGVKPNEHEELPDLMRQVFEAPAKRSVLLGFLLREIIKQQQITANQEQVTAELKALAARYYAEPSEEMLSQMRQNQNIMATITYSILEEQVMAKLQDTAVVTDTPMTYDELMAALKTTAPAY